MEFGWLWFINVLGSSIVTNALHWTCDNNGGYACMGVKDIWEISVLLSRFHCEPNIALWKRLYKRIGSCQCITIL